MKPSDASMRFCTCGLAKCCQGWTPPPSHSSLLPSCTDSQSKLEDPCTCHLAEQNLLLQISIVGGRSQRLLLPFRTDAASRQMQGSFPATDRASTGRVAEIKSTSEKPPTSRTSNPTSCQAPGDLTPWTPSMGQASFGNPFGSGWQGHAPRGLGQTSPPGFGPLPERSFKFGSFPVRSYQPQPGHPYPPFHPARSEMGRPTFGGGMTFNFTGATAGVRPPPPPPPQRLSSAAGRGSTLGQGLPLSGGRGAPRAPLFTFGGSGAAQMSPAGEKTGRLLENNTGGEEVNTSSSYDPVCLLHVLVGLPGGGG